jgi:predicted Co/Zn/Cd cation transporter (cation efflux family)
MTDAVVEQQTLKLSVWLSALLGAFAVLLGLLSGSTAIVFDGLFSVIDVAMGVLGLWVARLVTREENRTFQYGYWHIEPMSLAFYGGLLIILCVYAFFDAAGTFMSGGTDVELGWAIGYSLVMAIACFGMYGYERRTNLAAKSAFIHLDAQGWLMSALATAATAAAFIFAWWLTSTPYAYLAPYVDPAILGILSLAMIGIPVRTVRTALTEILLMTPSELDAQVCGAMDAIASRHGFSGFTSYAAKVGRGQFIEIHIVVPPDRQLGTVADLDAIREEIADALDAHGTDKWLTVDFTGSEAWT